MTKNVGNIDKTIRITAGSILLVVALFMDLNTGWRAGLFIVSIIAFATAYVRF